MSKSGIQKGNWSGALNEDVDLCFHYTEKGIQQVQPVKPDRSLPVKPINVLALVFREPCFVDVGKCVFKVDQEGFYRFGVFPASVHNRIYCGSDIPRFAGAITHLHQHGWRHNKVPLPELLQKAEVSCASVTCWTISTMGIHLFTEQGIRARRVSTFTLEKWNSYNCGHCLFEYFDPNEKRWLLADSDLGHMFRAKGRWLDADTVCRLARNGEPWEAVPVARGLMFDTVGDGVEQQNHFFALMMNPGTIGEGIRPWYERILQVPLLGEEYTVDTPAQKKRFEALCGTAKLHYEYLPPRQFHEKYYPKAE